MRRAREPQNRAENGAVTPAGPKTFQVTPPAPGSGTLGNDRKSVLRWRHSICRVALELQASSILQGNHEINIRVRSSRLVNAIRVRFEHRPTLNIKRGANAGEH